MVRSLSTFREHVQNQRDTATSPQPALAEPPEAELSGASSNGATHWAEGREWAVTAGPDTARRGRSLEINLPVWRVALGVALVAGALAAADVLVQTLGYTVAPPIPAWGKLTKLLDLDREASLPTWFAVALLWGCALLLGAIALAAFRGRDRFRFHWAGLALVFMAMSIDEQILAHESVGSAVHRLADTSGVLYYAWVIPAACTLAPFGLLYLRFLTSLPRRTTRLFLLAAIIYIGGALGMELIGSWWVDQYGSEDHLIYETITSIEEIGELAGASIFFYALLDYLRDRVRAVRFDLL